MSATRWSRIVLLFTVCLTMPFASGAQQPTAATGTTEMSLRKSVQEREFRGRKIAGEERQIGRGDSLWRILVEEKGLSGKKFRSYLVVVRGLNPQIKNLDLLRIGDKLFVPLRPGDFDNVPEGAAAGTLPSARPEAGRTASYRVKAGESLYRILRQQYKITELRELAQYASLVKDLNPQRTGDWDTLYEGEILRLPVLGAPDASTSAEIAKPAGGGSSITRPESAAKEREAPAPDRAQVLRAPAQANMPLFGSIVAAIGSDFQSSGEETITLTDGAIHFDKSSYPVIYNAALRQRVVIDPKGDIPASLRSKLNDPRIGTPVIPMNDGLSLQDAVKQLFAALGYKPLPNERPIVVQEGAVAFEAKGDWMALAPAVSNKAQDIFVVNLTDHPEEVPDYLRAELAKLGVTLRSVALPQDGAEPGQNKPARPRQNLEIKNWPADKRELVNAVLLAFGIPFGVAETLSVEMSDGLRVDTRADRVFEVNNQPAAILFRRADPAIRKALQERQRVRVVELDLDALSSRELIARTLAFLGEPVAYSEHRFSAAQGSTQDRLTLKAWGFNLADRAMFITDRQIPATLQRFFFEKGLNIVYFR